MTILVGDNNTTGFTNADRIFCSGRGNFQLYTCGTTGLVTTLALYWGDTSAIGTEGLVLFLCNTSGVVLTSTGVITTPTSGTQFVSGSCSAASVTSGTQYYIGFIGDPNNNSGDGRLGVAYATVSGDFTDTTTTFTYPAPPSTWGAIGMDFGNPTWKGYGAGGGAAATAQPRLTILGAG